MQVCISYRAAWHATPGMRRYAITKALDKEILNCNVSSKGTAILLKRWILPIVGVGEGPAQSA